MDNNRGLLFCGDIHGELNYLVNVILKAQNKISESDIIICGDFGVGFGGPNSLDVLYDKVKKTLEENDLNIYAIRGNHDDPAYFDGTHTYDRLKLLKDHEVVEICGKKIYPIGGGISVDIDFPDAIKGRSRREYNNYLISLGSSKRVWWPDEEISKKTSDLPIKVDVIVSHEAPLSFDPPLIRESQVQYETYKKILDDRNYLDFVLREVRSSWWFYGHYHHSYCGHSGETNYRCLGINELFQLSN